MNRRWHAALGYALTGEVPDLPGVDAPDVTVLLAGLAAAGWTAERIATNARNRAEAELVWPYPVPVDLRAGCGPAQLAAALAAARADLGLATLTTRSPSAPRRLDADEQRLLREVPPHHGS